MNELELKHILPYTPYDIRVETKYGVTQVVDVDVKGIINKLYGLNGCKLLLRPISSITKEEIVEINELSPCNIFINITNNGDVFIEDDECFNEAISIELIDSIEVVNWFFSKHFDVFGLIDRGLAIEK